MFEEMRSTSRIRWISCDTRKARRRCKYLRNHLSIFISKGETELVRRWFARHLLFVVVTLGTMPLLASLAPTQLSATIWTSHFASPILIL